MNIIQQMNISTDKEIGITQKKFTFLDQGSPSFSPLHGLSQPSEDFDEYYIPNLEIDPLFVQQERSNMAEDLIREDSFEHSSNLRGSLKPIKDGLEDTKKVQQNKDNFLQQQQANLPSPIESLEPKNIISLLNFLVSNTTLQEWQTKGYAEYFSDGNEILKNVFQILSDKFRKLRKTKEQMTKYCMRKAFKFISEYKNNIRKKGSSRTETESIISKINYEIPFKKNSQQKTMNSQFLKQTFSHEEFIVGYRQFLKQIHQFIEQDNALKINAFAEAIQKAIQTKDMEKVRKWNRLPWTDKILEKTEKLARNLMDYAEENIDNHSQQKQDSSKNVSNQL